MTPGLNQFYSVWTLPDPSTSVEVSNNGTAAGNMIALVAVPPIPEPVSIQLLALGAIGMLIRRR